jgi:hypothetical protein
MPGGGTSGFVEVSSERASGFIVRRARPLPGEM